MLEGKSYREAYASLKQKGSVPEEEILLLEMAAKQWRPLGAEIRGRDAKTFMPGHIRKLISQAVDLTPGNTEFRKLRDWQGTTDSALKAWSFWLAGRTRS